jgi:hypothetical protein
MTDVSIYIAVITAAAGVAGAAVSPVALAFKDGRQAKRDRTERQATAVREACVSLLRAAGELRTQVANNHSYHGTDMGVRVEAVRQLGASTQLLAAAVEMLVPTVTAELATQLATAAGNLTGWTEQHTNLQLGVMAEDPPFGELDTCLAAFRKQAVRDIRLGFLVLAAGQLQRTFQLRLRQRWVHGVYGLPGQPLGITRAAAEGSGPGCIPQHRAVPRSLVHRLVDVTAGGGLVTQFCEREPAGGAGRWLIV